MNYYNEKIAKNLKLSQDQIYQVSSELKNHQHNLDHISNNFEGTTAFIINDHYGFGFYVIHMIISLALIFVVFGILNIMTVLNTIFHNPSGFWKFIICSCIGATLYVMAYFIAEPIIYIPVVQSNIKKQIDELDNNLNSLSQNFVRSMSSDLLPEIHSLGAVSSHELSLKTSGRLCDVAFLEKILNAGLNEFNLEQILLSKNSFLYKSWLNTGGSNIETIYLDDD